MDHVVNFIQSLVFRNILFQKKHIVAANHNMWSNSAIRECVDVYDELSHFIELPMDRFTHTTHFSERHRKFEVIFIRFSDAYRTIRITSIRIFTSPISAKAVLFSVLHVFVSWFDYVGAEKRYWFWHPYKKSHPSINHPKVWHNSLRFHYIQYPLLALHTLFTSKQFTHHNNQTYPSALLV